MEGIPRRSDWPVELKGQGRSWRIVEFVGINLSKGLGIKYVHTATALTIETLHSYRAMIPNQSYSCSSKMPYLNDPVMSSRKV